MEQFEWEQLSPEQKKIQLYLEQKKTLEAFLERGAISKAQFDKSLGDLTVKMGMTGLAQQACYNDLIQGRAIGRIRKDIYMGKRRIVVIALLGCIALTGCVSKAEYDALEERVSRLEQNYGYNEPPASSGQNIQAPLSEYIKNWDEVITILEQEFGRSDFTITEWEASKDFERNEASIKNFGNGKYYILVDGSEVHITVKQHTALVVAIQTGEGFKQVQTPSYTDELYYGD